MGNLIKWIVVGVVVVIILVVGVLIFLPSDDSQPETASAPTYNIKIPQAQEQDQTATTDDGSDTDEDDGSDEDGGEDDQDQPASHHTAKTPSHPKNQAHKRTGPATVIPRAIKSSVLANIPNEKRLKRLPKAPIQKINQSTDIGSLPVIGKDGTKPWRLYAKPYKFMNTRPKVAIVMGPIGLSNSQFKLAIDKMPLETTFILSPYSRNITEKSQMIRMKGHEFLLEFPTESMSYDRDSGPNTLKRSQTPTQLLDSINVLLASTTGYIGAAVMYGDSFAANRSKLHIVVSELNSRGLLTFDDGSAGPRSTLKVLAVKAVAPYAITDTSLQPTQTTTEVAKLLQATYVNLAHGKNQVILLDPQPRLMEMVINWVKIHGARKRNGTFELVPLSSISKNRN